MSNSFEHFEKRFFLFAWMPAAAMGWISERSERNQSKGKRTPAAA